MNGDCGPHPQPRGGHLLFSGTLDSVCCLGIPLEKTAGDTTYGDPADISGLIMDTTGEHFGECCPAAGGLCLERFSSRCS